MEPAYKSLLSVRYKVPKVIPYGPAKRDDGENYGFKDVKSDLALVDGIPELNSDPALKALIVAINGPETGLFSVGCVSGGIQDDNGFRCTGYVEFALNSATAVTNAANYFPVFYHFSRFLFKQQLAVEVTYNWELEPGHFSRCGVDGFTCAIFVNTHYLSAQEAAGVAWRSAIGALTEYLPSVSAIHNDPIVAA